MTECPGETTLSDLLAGMLSPDRRDAVLGHVETCAGCQWVLEACRTWPPESVPLKPGATFARYVVERQLGAGAMGVVYAARDPSLARQVALKVLRPEGRDIQELQRRLLHEAQALARLSHPNVVTIHDVGTHEDSVFLAMELVEGTTLEQWLQQERPWRDVVRIFQEAGRGLAAAHSAGLVHRDFKPANVLVGAQGRVYVTDFGVARPILRAALPPPPELLRVDAVPPGPLTRTGALLGTPAYMAPELLDGGAATERSDQFSFCVALYEALHGVRPFAGADLETLARAAREGTLQPGERPTRVPAWLRRVVQRGLQARPEDRFPSMEALLAALTPPRGLPRTLALGLLALLGLATAGGAYAWAHRNDARCEQVTQRLTSAWNPTRKEKLHQAVLATKAPYAESLWTRLAPALDAHAERWRALRRESCEAQGDDTSTPAWQSATCLDARLWRFTATLEVLEQADPVTLQNTPRLMESLQGLDECRDTPALATRPQPPDALRARVDAVRGKLAQVQALLFAGQYAAALTQTPPLLAALPDVGFRPLEAEVLLAQGDLLGKSGKMKEAEETLYKAVYAAEAGGDDESTARAWVLLLWVVGNELARVDDTERITQHARAAVERVGRARFPVITSDLHLWRAVVLRQRGKLDQAEEEAMKGLAFSRERHGPASPYTAMFLFLLGQLRHSQQRSEESLAFLSQAHDILEPLFVPEHPTRLSLDNSIALSQWMLGRTEEAIEGWRRILAIQERTQAPEHIALAAPLLNLGSRMRLGGRLDEGRKHLERSLAIVEKAHGPNHPRAATTLVHLASLELDAGNLDKALEHCDQSVARLRDSQGPETSRAAIPLVVRGQVHLAAGRFPQARRDLLEALRLHEREYGQDSIQASEALTWLGNTALAEGHPREAMEHCRRALAVDEKDPAQQQLLDVALELTCIAEAHLALKEPDQALPLLERAWDIHTRHPPLDPLDAGRGAFLLARALAERHPAPDLDLERSARLMSEARARLGRLGVRAAPELRNLEARQQREASR
ncbi:serine/threonine-protein kinase [Myxococcus stipitatus]|uniref:serine/threonine-protein kinase n=1 Tax=Myxococcus stipitatus TaxID=83455 RepID=UPI001F366CD8|nr:serine/threonine-protein kinase [Myxococcus stipitatus]MCE9673406.1 serine/threonine-protein kinase [Myxococcus stipitatus]